LLFIITSIAGYANFQIISFHFKNSSTIPEVQIPIFFAIAMASSGLSALISGRIFDKKGLLTLSIVPILTIPITPLAFSNNQIEVLASIILWGIVMGIQETIIRAAIPTMIPNLKRGTAYGIFNFAYGLSWFCGSTLMGILYNISIQYIILFSIIIESISFPLLYKVIKETKKQNQLY
ncbi:MAG TPA: MFS transporter, partial [Verrucomicrobiae bacterium]|nr:MFS transporter [Verrucomicrobiae bacterium]